MWKTSCLRENSFAALHTVPFVLGCAIIAYPTVTSKLSSLSAWSFVFGNKINRLENLGTVNSPAFEHMCRGHLLLKFMFGAKFNWKTADYWRWRLGASHDKILTSFVNGSHAFTFQFWSLLPQKIVFNLQKPVLENCFLALISSSNGEKKWKKVASCSKSNLISQQEIQNEKNCCGDNSFVDCANV